MNHQLLQVKILTDPRWIITYDGYTQTCFQHATGIEYKLCTCSHDPGRYWTDKGTEVMVRFLPNISHEWK